MDTNTQQVGVPKVNCFIIPLKDVFITLRNHITSIQAWAQIDWFEYVRCMMNYIFDENQMINPVLDRTECRTMLMQQGFTEEQMVWVEHNVLGMALMLMGDAHAYIKMLSREDRIIGFHWNINNSHDLVIIISYK